MKKIIALLLVAFMLLPFAVSCSDKNGDGTDITNTDGNAESAPKNITLAQSMRANYKVIIPADSDDELTAAATSLINKLGQVTGTPFSMGQDSDTEPVDSSGEIIIGSCMRKDTVTALKGTGYKDYKITVTNNNIVLAAHTDEAAMNAVFKFMSYLTDELLTKDSQTKATVLFWEKDYSFVHENYSVKALSLNGNTLDGYTIVYSENDCPEKNKEYAQKLRELIGEACGYVLSVKGDAAEQNEFEILVGKTNRAESLAYAASLGSLEYVTAAVGNKLVIVGNGAYTTAKAIDAFDTNMRVAAQTLEDIDIKRSLVDGYEQNTVGDYRLMQYNVLVEFEGWGSGGKIEADVDVRKEIVAAAILGYAPDVIVLCEFFDNWRNKLTPLIQEQYTLVQGDRADGVSNRSPIMYRTDKFDLIDSGITDIEKANGMINRRAVTWAVLKDKSNGEQLIVFGTHLSSEQDSSGETDRINEIKKMSKIMSSVTESYEGHVILMGDFNSYVGSKAYNSVKEETALTNAVEALASSMNTVDYVFLDNSSVSKNIILKFGNQTEFASDHRPVICDIKIK